MNYNLDLECLSVQEYRKLLKKQNLLPGRRVLWQDIDKNFALLESQGINTIAQLKKILSTPVKITAFAAASRIPEDYLVILKREIGSLEQKPVPLAAFPGINPSLIKELNEVGLKTSKDYFEHDQTKPDELFCLCNLVRINGVGPAAAKHFTKRDISLLLISPKPMRKPCLRRSPLSMKDNIIIKQSSGKKICSFVSISRYYLTNIAHDKLEFIVEAIGRNQRCTIKIVIHR